MGVAIDGILNACKYAVIGAVGLTPIPQKIEKQSKVTLSLLTRGLATVRLIYRNFPYKRLPDIAEISSHSENWSRGRMKEGQSPRVETPAIWDFFLGGGGGGSLERIRPSHRIHTVISLGNFRRVHLCFSSFCKKCTPKSMMASWLSKLPQWTCAAWSGLEQMRKRDRDREVREARPNFCLKSCLCSFSQWNSEPWSDNQG